MYFHLHIINKFMFIFINLALLICLYLLIYISFIFEKEY